MATGGAAISGSSSDTGNVSSPVTMDNLLARPDIGSAELPSSSLDELEERPDFVDAERLRDEFGCGICAEVAIQPQLTSCGQRMCKKYIDDQFGGDSVIPCPVSHDEEELRKEECQLHRNSVYPDRYTHKLLLKERCFCANKMYGCCEEPLWKKLKQHEKVCGYVPVRCSNLGCGERFASLNLIHHKSKCSFAKIECRYCQLPLLRIDLEDHLQLCEKVDNRCGDCKRPLKNLGPDSGEVAEQALNSEVKPLKHEQSLTGTRPKRVLPLERVTAETAMKVKKLTDNVNQSGDHMVNAMGTVGSQQTEAVQRRVRTMERELRDSGLASVPVIESIMQDLKRHNDREERIRSDPDSSSFRRPQSEMNIASGCPQLALHGEVESSSFRVGDCIYVRVRVEGGDDVIP